MVLASPQTKTIIFKFTFFCPTRLIPLLDPFIYARRLPWSKRDLAERTGDRLGVWARTASHRPATGGGWFVYEAKYPDYTDPVAQQWWRRMIRLFHDRHLTFDGLTIDLNEPTSLSVFPARCSSQDGWFFSY